MCAVALDRPCELTVIFTNSGSAFELLWVWHESAPVYSGQFDAVELWVVYQINLNILYSTWIGHFYRHFVASLSV